MDPIFNPGYRYATQRYDLDGETIDFEFNFAGGYISQDYVRCFFRTFDRVETEIARPDIVFVGPNQVRVAIAATQPVDVEMIVIRRVTPKDLPLVDFNDDAIINERNLDKNARQAIHAIAEMVDYFADILDLFYFLNDQIIDALDEMNLLIAIVNGLIDDFNALLANLNFLQMNDTPNSYAGQAEKVVSVNTAENGLIFRDLGDVVYEGGGRSSFSLDATEYVESITNPEYVNMSLNDTAVSYAGTRDFVATVVETETALNLRPNSRAAFGIKELMRPSLLPSWPITETPYLDIDTSEMITTAGTRVSVPSARYNLTLDATNYMEMEKATGAITVNQVGFTPDTHEPMYSMVVDATGEFDVVDHRVNFNFKEVVVDAGAFVDLTDTPADYVGHAGKMVVVKATEDGLEFTAPGGGGSGLAIGMGSSVDATYPNGVWMLDPTGFSTLPADGDARSTLKSTFIMGTDIDYQHRVDVTPSSTFPSDIIYGSGIKVKSGSSTLIGTEIEGRVADSVVIGNKINAGGVTTTGVGTGTVSASIIIATNANGSSDNDIGGSVSNRVDVSKAILIGSMQRGSSFTVAGTYDKTINIGMNMDAFGSSKIANGSIRIGCDILNGLKANISNSVTIGRGETFLQPVAPGSFNLQHKGDAAYIGSNFVNECRSHKISYARQLNNITTPTFIYAGGVTDASTYYTQLGNTGLFRVKGAVVLKNDSSVGSFNLWEVVAYVKGGGTIVSQTWTRINNDYAAVADPYFTASGNGRLSLFGGGVASTIVYYSAIFDVEVL